MKRLLVILAAVLAACVFTLAVLYPQFTTIAIRDISDSGEDPDLPPRSTVMDRAEFKLRRAEAIGLKRGYDKDNPPDPKLRQQAIKQMSQQEADVAVRPPSAETDALLAPWSPIGPAPIPNGQVVSGLSTPASGRVISIAVHPTNPSARTSLFTGLRRGCGLSLIL